MVTLSGIVREQEPVLTDVPRDVPQAQTMIAASDFWMYQIRISPESAHSSYRELLSTLLQKLAVVDLENTLRVFLDFCQADDVKITLKLVDSK